MWTDVINLRAFYASGLGRIARRMIVRQIRAMWPDVHGLSLLGLGFATPFLGPFQAEAERVVAAMPAGQGVLRRPGEGGIATVLVNEANLPFADRSVDRVMIVHGLECSQRGGGMVREVWRILADDGRLLVVAPNRRGLWARFEHTPFGHGQPYSAAQLTHRLRDTLFTPLRSGGALFVPPVDSRMVLSSAMAWEKVGQRWFPGFAGVVVLEAAKQIYAGEFNAARAPAKAYAPLVSR